MLDSVDIMQINDKRSLRAFTFCGRVKNDKYINIETVIPCQKKKSTVLHKNTKLEKTLAYPKYKEDKIKLR